MKNALFIVFIMSLSFVGFGQYEVTKMEYTVDVTQQKQPAHVEYLSDSQKTEPLFYTKYAELNNGHLIFYNRLSLLGLVTIPIASTNPDGNQLIPSIGIVNFNTKENKINYTLENIHLHDIWLSGPLDYSVAQLKPIRQEIGNNTTHKHLSELKAMYPPAFHIPENKYVLTTKRTAEEKNETQYILTETNKSVEFSNLSNIPVIKSTDSIYIVNTKSIFEKLHGHNHFVYNPVLNTWTSLRGENRDGKKEKLSEYRNLHFVTSDSKGKILQDTKVNFEFTRNAALHQFIRDVKNPDDGKIIYIFERQAMLLGNGKFNDPDKNNYDLIVLNSNGTLAYRHQFKAGETGNDSFSPLYCYLNNEKIYIAGRTGDGLMMLAADSTGLKITQEDVTNSSGANNARINYNWELYDSKVINNQLYFWGEQRKLVQAASSNPQTGQKVPEIIHYINFSVVQIDLSKNVLVRQYAFERTEGDLQKRTHLEDVFTVNNKVVFYTSHTKRIKELQESENSNRLNFYSNEQYYKSGADYNLITRPLLYTIDPVSKAAGTYKIQEASFSNLYPRNSWLSDNKNLYLIGFEDNKKQDELTYKVIVIGF